MMARKHKEKTDERNTGNVQHLKRDAKHEDRRDAGGVAVAPGNDRKGDLGGPVASQRLPVAVKTEQHANRGGDTQDRDAGTCKDHPVRDRGDEEVDRLDFHLCETPQGDRVAYRIDSVVAFRRSGYLTKPRQLVLIVGGQQITVNETPRILGSREQAERWVMR